jgi:hypothetical protein
MGDIFFWEEPLPWNKERKHTGISFNRWFKDYIVIKNLMESF